MKEELKKSLTNLIDETLLELEELKKSRFSAEEIKIKGPGADELAGKPVNGKLTEKAEEEPEEEEQDGGEDPEDEEEAEEEEAEKAEKSETVAKAEDKKDEDKKDCDCHDDPKHEEKEKEAAKKILDMHKSVEEFDALKKSVGGMETLMKSYVDEKLAPLSTQLDQLIEAVNALSNAPVPAKGASYKDVAPLAKSNESVEVLSKSEVASKLVDLKKSGTRVDSADVARAEMGHDLEQIIAKYNIQ